MDIEGKTINNKYRIIKKIVDGELSTVWTAENLIDSANVLINLVKKDLSIRIEDVIRFRNEALEVSKINVPGIEKILDIGECEDYHYVIREPVQGKSLLEMICEGAVFNIDEAVGIIYGICNALNHAHEANIRQLSFYERNEICLYVYGNSSLWLVKRIFYESFGPCCRNR